MEYDRLVDSEYLLSLPSASTPNLIVINSPELDLKIDSESILSSSVVSISVKNFEIEAKGSIETAMSLKAVEISEKDYICGVMGASHVGLGYFGSSISYTNCLDDFFKKYYKVISLSDNKKVTIGQRPNYFKVNQYYDQPIYSRTGGAILIRSRERTQIKGNLRASGTTNKPNNDIILGSSSGGTVYLESPMISVSGTPNAKDPSSSVAPKTRRLSGSAARESWW